MIPDKNRTNMQVKKCMKRYRRLSQVILVFLMFFTIAMPVSAKKDDKVKVEFKEMVHNFGNIREDGGPVTYEFEFQNTDKTPIIVVQASAECGCTTPDFPKQPISSGKTGKISVTYNPLGRPGGFDKVVTVKIKTMGGKDKSKLYKFRLKIRGSVIPKK